MKIVFDKKCLEYKFEGHPESPERVEKIYKTLKENSYKFSKPKLISEKEILEVHKREHLENLKKKNYFDPDSPPIDFIFPLISASAAVKAAEIRGFSICRPPGHHAGKNFLGGFCYLNNIVIAVKTLGLRTAILDLDAHHGNGAQDIFLGSKDILYVSLHEYPLYPGTGYESEKNCINFSLPHYTSESSYLKVLSNALEIIEEFKPEILAVSIGFDTYSKDPLTTLQLEKESYVKIGKMITSLNLPMFLVLEGGYSEEIGELALNFLKGLEF